MIKIEAIIAKTDNRQQKKLKAKIQFFAKINKIDQLLYGQPNSNTNPDEDYTHTHTEYKPISFLNI